MDKHVEDLVITALMALMSKVRFLSALSALHTVAFALTWCVLFMASLTASVPLARLRDRAIISPVIPLFR